jgi:hypothetical protein
MRKFIVLAAVLSSLLTAGTAHAGLIGKKIEGTLSTDSNSQDQWDIARDTISGKLEFRSFADGNRYNANFSDRRLVIRDMERPRETGSGWQMTFQLLSPAEFKNIKLVRSTFGANLTFSLIGNLLTINWTGDQAYQALTKQQRRELGREKFYAVFQISERDVPVPEPSTVALMLAGIVAAGAFSLHRRKHISV